MLIVALSDIHGSIENLELIGTELAGAELVLVAGDITHFGGWDKADYVIGNLRKYNPRILAVSGNCDRQDVEDYLGAEEIGLHCRCVDVNGVIFAGISGAYPEVPPAPNETGENGFERCVTIIESKISADKPLVLLTHQPARGTNIDCISGRHAGSEAIRDFVVRNRPILAVSGHIHEAIGTDKVGETVLVNPGPLRRGHWARIEIVGRDVRTELRTVD